MLTPEYLADLPEPIVELYSEAERAILADMARRISTYDYWIPSADWQNQKLLEAGKLQKDILAELSKTTGKSVEELRKLMQQAANEGLRVDRRIYENAGYTVPPFSESEPLREVLNAGYTATANTMKNLTRTTASTAARQFERVLDHAWMKVSSGAFSVDEATRSAVKELSEQGVRCVSYASGREDTLETAVRRAVVTGVNQTCGKLQMELADELGSDLMELTAHADARPSHAVWQGKIVSLSGQDGYLSLDDIGYGTVQGFQGANCRHGWNPWFEGMPRTWTDEALEKLKEKKYTYNGEQLTEYEAQQKLRAMERGIRRWKREYTAMKAAGQDASEAAVKLRAWEDKAKDFVQQTGLKRKTAREQVAGFGHKEASEASATATLVLRREIEYNKRKNEIQNLIRSDETTKSINIGNQEKHIKDSGRYIAGRSYIYGDLNTARALVEQYHGTGEVKLRNNFDWTKKEFVVADHPVGVVVDVGSGKETETRRFSIHYGKKGTHIVPAKEVE